MQPQRDKLAHYLPLHVSSYFLQVSLTLALLPVLPPAVARLAEARGHAQLRLAHLVLLPVAGRVLAHDASVDPKADSNKDFSSEG